MQNKYINTNKKNSGFKLKRAEFILPFLSNLTLFIEECS